MPKTKEDLFDSDSTELLDDEEACTVGNKLIDLGTIQVSFVRFRPREGLSDGTDHAALESLVVHEKSKKVGCHQIVYVHFTRISE